jgi:dihydrofolate reductase
MKASVFVGTSLDGFIARTDGSFDFLSAGGDEPHGYEEFMATVDALVLGRNTFETAHAFPSWPYGKTPVFVLSSRALPPVPAGAVVERLSGDPSEIFANLSARGIGHVYVDGGLTIQAFLRAGLVQRVVVTRVPVLIGAGIPLFGATGGRDIALRHVATRSYAGGLVQSEYEVVGSTAKETAPGA